MKYKFLVISNCLTLTAVLNTGCLIGGDKGSLTSVDGDKKLNELSDQEEQTLCEETSDALVNVAKEMQCRMLAYQYAAVKDPITGGVSIDEKSCEGYLSNCMDGSGPNVDSEGADAPLGDCSDGDLDFGDCEATVAVFDACMLSMVLLSMDMVERISCSSMLDEQDLEELKDQLEQMDQDDAPTEACAELATQCPDFFGETENQSEESSGLGEPCTTSAQCSSYEEDYCAFNTLDNTGYCTIEPCQMGGCPGNYTCCDCGNSPVLPQLQVCLTADDALDASTMGDCTCDD